MATWAPRPHWGASSVAPAGLACFIVTGALTGPVVSFHGLSWGWSLSVVALLALTLLFLALTHLLDPGYLPPAPCRDPLIPALEQRAAECAATTFDMDGRTYTRGRVWMRHAPDARRLERYCTSCNIWRPPRAHHCRVCEACVDHFDHHCMVVGACVAKLNHRWFTLFLLSALCMDALLAAGACVMLRRAGFPGKLRGWHAWAGAVLALVYAYFLLVLLFGVAHLAMMTLDLTSKDVASGALSSTSDLPCCPGERSPARLVAAWRELWCGPCRGRRRRRSTSDHTDLTEPIRPEPGNLA